MCFKPHKKFLLLLALMMMMCGIGLAQLQLSVSITNSNCGEDNGIILATATGGTPPYTYSFSGGPFQSSRLYLIAGVYDYPVVVKDATGALAYATAPMGNDKPRVVVFAMPSLYPSGCTASDGAATVTGANGVPPYTYSIDGINWQTGTTFSGLASGVYTLLAKDANGCIGKTLFPLAPRNCNAQYSLGGTLTPYVCNTEGYLNMEVNSGTGPFQYSMDGVNFQSSPRFEGLGVGIHTLYVKDGNGALFRYGYGFYSYCLYKVAATVTNVTCGNTDGRIEATAVNGTAPYQYSLDGVNFQSSNIFTGLAVGNYTVVAKDITGRLATTLYGVGGGCLSVSATPTHVVCGYNNGKITVTASGGTAPYQYSLDGGAYQTSNEFTLIGRGTYTITVRDATGATANTITTINNSPGPVFTVTSTPTSCTFNDGTITVSVSSGSPPYQYSLNNIDFQTSNVFTGVYYNGHYSVYVKDANGCTIGQCCTSVLANCFSLNVNVTDATCGNSDGTITVTAGGGTAPYEFSLDGINFQSSNVFSGLAPGDYTITGRDAGGVTRTAQATIRNSCITLGLFATNASCGQATGTITATASNGTSPYSYSINGTNYQGNHIFQNVLPGNYTVTVKDANGLITTSNVIVGNTPGPGISATTLPASCANNDGNITITNIGGTSPFTYSLNNGNYQTSPVYNGVPSGSFTADIKDANGCHAAIPVVVDLNDNLVVDAGPDIPLCEGTTKTIQATSNGTSFTWTPVATLNNTSLLNPVASPALTTKYYITAKLGICDKMDSVIVLVNAAPVADAGDDAFICFGQSAQLQGSGGLSYSWSPATHLDNAAIADPFSNKPASTISYRLVVTDANGCKSLNDESVTVFVTPPAKLFAGNDTSIFINEPVQLHAQDVNGSGFTNFTWSPGTGLSNPALQNPVATTDRTITYMVVASTPAGCEARDTIKITAYALADIFVPNGFTPNGDGKNDLFKAIPIGIKEFKYLAVFNRYGQRVFYSTEPGAGWNGTINQKNPETGTYTWMAAGISIKGDLIKRSGTVTLIR